MSNYPELPKAGWSKGGSAINLSQNAYTADQMRAYCEDDRAMRAQADEKQPPFGSKRNAALALYRPPFTFMHGYIHDADGHMVSDDDGVDKHIAQRVRGWGRMSYMPDAAALQDEVGAVIAQALTEFWERNA